MQSNSVRKSQESKAKVSYTPGPWEAIGLTVIEATGQHRDIGELFSCHEFTVEISEVEAEANAHLIAAAPEMLAELEYQRDRNYNSFEPDNQSNSYKRLDAMIRKAKGGQ